MALNTNGSEIIRINEEVCLPSPSERTPARLASASHRPQTHPLIVPM